jgi:predicted aldo/keto reductase-like oxidoreductase
MEKIRFGSTGLEVSKVAMGGIPIMRLDKKDAVKVVRSVVEMGINFIDTANAYGDSEEKIGEAIKKYTREDIILASKSMARDSKTLIQHIDLSLKRLGTDYIDIYQLHAVSNSQTFEQVMAPGGAYDGLEKAISSGKVRHNGFSSHNVPISEKMMKSNKFQVTQIPLNFLDIEAESLVPIARELDMGFIAMKPMGGGLLEDAGLAFRYLNQFQGVVPDPGIEKIEEMTQIIGIVKDQEPFSDIDKEMVKKIKQETGDSWCHRCGYCLPCSQDINIPMALVLKSTLKRSGDLGAERFCKPNIEKAYDCIECGECIERCPYELDIPELIKDNIKIWEEYLDSCKQD